MKPVPKPCIVCSARVTDGTARCAKHKVGGRMMQPCMVCGRSSVDRYCPRHQPELDEATRNARNPYRQAYHDPEYARNRQIRFERANGRCEGCGKQVVPGGWHCHHVVEIRKGGSHAVENLRILCTEDPNNCHKRAHQLLRGKH